MTSRLAPLPPAYVPTRNTLHAVAEHVVSPTLYAAIGRIGLRAHAGGFATPAFGDDSRRVAVESGVLVDGDRRLALDGSTIAAAAALVGIAPGAPTDVYAPTTKLDAEDVLVVDTASATALGEWYVFVDDALRALAADATDASAIQLWPEHFDLACDLGDKDTGRRANYGGSPGDGGHVEPYLYVGPWDIARLQADDPGFFTESWGAALSYADLLAAPDPQALAVDFFRSRRERVQA